MRRIGEKEVCLKWPFCVWMFLTAYSSSWGPADIPCICLLPIRICCSGFVGAPAAGPLAVMLSVRTHTASGAVGELPCIA